MRIIRPKEKRLALGGDTKASQEANCPNNNLTIADIPASEKENGSLAVKSRCRAIAPKNMLNTVHNHRTERGTEVRREYACVEVG